MDFLNSHLLSLILFSPLAAALIVLLLPGQNKNLARRVALVLSLVPLALTLLAWFGFEAAPVVDGFRFQEQTVWYSAINSNYHLGIDGLSLSMVLLTTILTPIAILASFSVEEKVKTYMALFLALETGMLGVFLSLDLLLFFVFWEIGLVPMFFLIDQWGSAKGERELWNGMKVPARRYASFKFMIYTMAGSLGLLLAIQMIGVVSGTFDLIAIFQSWPALQGTLFGLPVATVKSIAFWAFAIAFAIKVPVWPFHTWLPDAHTEAPTAGSMILAGVLLKLGAYGFLRLVLPLYPEQAQQYAGVLALLATAAIVFGALSAWAQTDFKRLVAYSSVNHMGFVVLGIAAAAYAAGTESATIAMNGAVLQMFNHGISAAAMFFLVGVIYERTHTRDLEKFGGLFPLVPLYGALLILSSMASLGLPGLNGFVSEFLVVRGAWPIFTAYTAISMIGLFFTGAYILKGIAKTLHGPLNEEWKGHVSEINGRELLVMAPLVVLMLWLGFWPAWLLNVINQAVVALFG
ncbi:MAG: NADH-quinone oxidoreductase subunit M [Anaerolineales bacterium]|nr:MAG: NADH-quinone oxidoreductase subunit M [Anaerolineales bacterium]